MSNFRQVVVRGGPSGLSQQIDAGGHPLLADEPFELGGQDTGPNPYDLLLASLGACTSITLRLYADRKGWPLKGVTVKLQQEKIHAKDCKNCESEDGFVTKIDREISLEGNLTPEQRERLLLIAGRCPVAKTLEGDIKIEDRLA